MTVSTYNGEQVTASSPCTEHTSCAYPKAHFFATAEQCIENTQFLQFTLSCADIMHKYSAHSDLWILLDQADQIIFHYFCMK